MLPAEGNCQLVGAAAAAAGLSSETDCQEVSKLFVQSFPLNFATVIKWKSELSDLTEFYCSLFFWASFQNPFEKLWEKPFFFFFREKLKTSKQIVRIV